MVEVLNIKNPEGLEFNETAVFERSGSSDLTLGDYYIQLSDIFNEAGIDDPWVKPVIEFSAGVDPEATTDIDSVFYDNFILAAEGDIPPGWICSSDNGDIRYPGASGGGYRMFEFAEGVISTLCDSYANRIFFCTTAFSKIFDIKGRFEIGL